MSSWTVIIVLMSMGLWTTANFDANYILNDHMRKKKEIKVANVLNYTYL